MAREIKDLMGEWLEGEGLGDLNRLLRVREQWQKVVGDELGANSRPYRLEGEKLYVGVNSHAWAQELHYRIEGIKSRLEEVAGVKIKEIVVKKINLK